MTTTGPQLAITDDSLMNEAIEFLRSEKGCLPQIAAEIGVPVRYFYDLTSGRRKNPGARQIEKILRYKRLSGETLQTGLLAG
jgi:phage portal protein BeeE